MSVISLIIILSLFIFGSIFGSFAGAQVWRIRARQLKQDKADGEPVDAHEYARLKPLLAKSVARDRSLCLHCKHPLAWYDLIPVMSWLSTGGNCRYCHKPIGIFEFAIETLLPIVMIISYLFWPWGGQFTLYGIALFVIWIIALILLAILFAYDAKWYLLPNSINYTLAGVGLIYATLHIVRVPELALSNALSCLSAVGIMSGIYLILYVVSRGAWIGFGDVKLGIGLGLLLMSWEMAFLALFLANLLGLIYVLPLMAMRKVTRTSRIPFGPFLIAATVIAVVFGQVIVDWYLNFSTKLLF